MTIQHGAPNETLTGLLVKLVKHYTTQGAHFLPLGAHIFYVCDP